MTTIDIARALDEEHLEYELLPHSRTMRARDEAEALGTPSREVGKTLILKGDAGFVRAVIPASERLDLAKAREHFGDKQLRLATEDELEQEYPDFELGAVPPIGGPAGDLILIDHRVAELDRVVFEAGTHEESIRMRSADLFALTGADRADICAD